MFLVFMLLAIIIIIATIYLIYRVIGKALTDNDIIKKKVKKIILIVGVVILSIGIGLTIRIMSKQKVIGIIYGAENDFIEIDNITYEKDYGSGFSKSDKGEFLGYVKQRNSINAPLGVYAVKGQDKNEYIYNSFENAFYKRQIEE